MYLTFSIKTASQSGKLHQKVFFTLKTNFNVRHVWAFFLLQLTCLPLMVLTAFSKVQQLEPVRGSHMFNTAELDYQVLQKMQEAVIEFPGMTLNCITLAIESNLSLSKYNHLRLLGKGELTFTLDSAKPSDSPRSVLYFSTDSTSA